MVYLSFAILHVRRQNQPIAQKYLVVCCGEIKSTDLTLASNPLMSILTGELYYLLGLDILAQPLGVLHLYTYTTPVLHLLTPINFLVWVENITCFFYDLVV